MGDEGDSGLGLETSLGKCSPSVGAFPTRQCLNSFVSLVSCFLELSLQPIGDLRLKLLQIALMQAAQLRQNRLQIRTSLERFFARLH